MKTQAAIIMIDESNLDFFLKMVGSNCKVSDISKIMPKIMDGMKKEHKNNWLGIYYVLGKFHTLAH